MSSFAIVGAGGLGGIYGACLARAGHDVHFLVREHAAEIRQQGWIVESVWGDFTLPEVSVYDNVDQIPKCDYIIVATKSTTNDQLLQTLLPPLIGPSTVAIVLQNGLFVEEKTADILGSDRVIGGCCFLCSIKIGPGHIRHSAYGRIEMGAYAGRNNRSPRLPPARLDQVADLFQSAKIPTTTTDNLLKARWRKLMWNIPFNGLSVVLNSMTDRIMQHPASRQLAYDLMLEVEQSASAMKIDVGAGHVDQMMEHTDQMVPYDSSMRLDFLAGRSMELEYIYQQPIIAALEHGFRPQKTIMLHQQLQFLNPNKP